MMKLIEWSIGSRLCRVGQGDVSLNEDDNETKRFNGPIMARRRGEEWVHGTKNEFNRFFVGGARQFSKQHDDTWDQQVTRDANGGGRVFLAFLGLSIIF